MKPPNHAGVRSMTGQGHATAQGELGTITVEVRTVNNRGFKCSSRISDSLSALENKIETLVRSLIHRGSVSLSVNWRRPAGENLPGVDQDVLMAYARQLQQVRATLAESSGRNDGGLTIELSSLMSLPGVIVSVKEERRQDDALWDFVQSAITEAIANLDRMREIEGANMAKTLTADLNLIGQSVEQIAVLAPRAVDTYQNRLETKISRILAERQIEVQAVDLLREIQLFADRADISEEVTRLNSHLQMFRSVLSGTAGEDRREPTGRKLDFVIQEMFRETNTIGSKAADAAVSAHVVEVKCAIERMRELVQNLE
jgi:uncharacterized protein (TIGR00255 family)